MKRDLRRIWRQTDVDRAVGWAILFLSVALVVVVFTV